MASCSTKTWGNGKEFWGISWDYDPQWILSEEQREIQGKLMECCRTVIRPNAVSSKTHAKPCVSCFTILPFSLTAQFQRKTSRFAFPYLFSSSCFLKSLFNRKKAHIIRNVFLVSILHESFLNAKTFKTLIFSAFFLM